MHGLARLTASSVVFGALAGVASPHDCECGTPRMHPMQRHKGYDAGPGGLSRFLYERELSRTDCEADRETTRGFVTPGYEHVAADPRAFREAWARPGEIEVRRLYANDPAIPAALRRSRPALPVGSEPYVAFIAGQAIPAVFVYVDRTWRCVVDVDGFIVSSLSLECGAAYAGSSTGRCMDFAGALAAAVVERDGVARVRLCTLLVAHGCGSVPAEAPPVPKP